MEKINCYNPGMDLAFYKQEDCKKPNCTKDYDPACMYNSQGQYICPKQKGDVNQGWHFVMSEGATHTIYKNEKD